MGRHMRFILGLDILRYLANSAASSPESALWSDAASRAWNKINPYFQWESLWISARTTTRVGNRSKNHDKRRFSAQMAVADWVSNFAGCLLTLDDCSDTIVCLLLANRTARTKLFWFRVSFDVICVLLVLQSQYSSMFQTNAICSTDRTILRFLPKVPIALSLLLAPIACEAQFEASADAQYLPEFVAILRGIFHLAP